MRGEHQNYKIGKPDEPGGGTVPHRSGVALSVHCQSLLRVNVEHEPAYKYEAGTDNLRACQFSDGAGYVFNRSRTGAEATIRTLELMAWRSGSQITVLSDATDMSLDTDPMVCDIRKTDVPDKLARLLNVYERVRGRADLEVPAEQGICFANGFLRGEPNDKEEVNLYYHLATEKDCLIAAWPLKST